MFTPTQLKLLRTEYSKIKTIDPNGQGYQNVCQMLDNLEVHQLNQLAKAQIPWISSLANNRISKLLKQK